MEFRRYCTRYGYLPPNYLSDTAGRVYLGVWTDGQLLVLDGKSGTVTKVLSLDDEFEWTWKLCWSDVQPNLTVHHGHSVVSFLNATYK